MSHKCATVVVKADNDYGQKTINLSDMTEDDVIIDGTKPTAPAVPKPTASKGKKSK